MDDTLTTVSRLTFDDKVIAKIANYSTQSVDGLLGMDGNVVDSLAETFTQEDRVMKGIKVNAGEKQVAIDMTVILAHDADARAVFRAVCERVSQAVARLTGLKLIAVNLHVSDIMTRREWQKKK